MTVAFGGSQLRGDWSKELGIEVIWTKVFGSSWGLENLDLVGDADTVLLDWAARDCRLGVDLGEFKDNLREMVRRLGGKRVFLMTMNPTWGDMLGRVFVGLGRYFEAVREVGREIDVPVIDLEKEWLKVDYKSYSPDGVHCEGNFIVPFVRKALEGGG